MRSVAFEAMGVLRRFSGGRARALWVSGAVIGLVSVWRGAAAVLCDVGADCVEDVVDGWAGRIGRWLILAIVFSAYAFHARRARRVSETAPPRIVAPRRRIMAHTTPALRRARSLQHHRARRFALRGQRFTERPGS